MFTIQQFAEKHDVSYTVVRKWIAQKRIEAQQMGHTWVILSEKRPKIVKRGVLTDAQREAWPKPEPKAKPEKPPEKKAQEKVPRKPKKAPKVAKLKKPVRGRKVA